MQATVQFVRPAADLVSRSALSLAPFVCLHCREKKYKHMWEGDKEAYIRRYEKAKKPLSSFEADIQKYLQLQVGVGVEDSKFTVLEG